MSKQKTIWHLGGWNRNYGDFVLQASIKENLMKNSDIPLNFVPIDYQNTHFFPELINRMNEEADLLLVGGGGAIFNRPEDKSLSGWQFSIKLEDLEKINIPIVIYGIGYNKFYYDNSGFKDGINAHLKKTQEISSLFSVRNHGTKRELISRGLDENDITVVPDAGSFLPSKSIQIPKLNSDSFKIGINLVSDRPFYTFPEPFEETKQEIIKNITLSLKHFIEEYNAQIICIEHIPLLDQEIVKYMKGELGDSFISLEENMPHLFPPSSVLAPFLVDIYRQMDIIIGMRGHANIIPFGTRTPFIALSSHNKNKFFLEDIGEEYILDIREYKDQLNSENVINMIEKLLAEKEHYLSRIDNKLREKTIEFEDFNKKVINLLG